MKIFTPATREIIHEMTCDRCKRRDYDIIDIQEYLSWRMRGGYGNTAFGDMTRLSLDLCQHCTKEVLGEWIKVEDGY